MTYYKFSTVGLKTVTLVTNMSILFTRTITSSKSYKDLINLCNTLSEWFLLKYLHHSSNKIFTFDLKFQSVESDHQI